ncbi:MAG: PhoH family protein [bacterium]|nr:PhoH family protein [bacterium]
MPSRKKTYIIDTSTGIHDPNSMNVLGGVGNSVVYPFGVIRQLDEKKTRQDLVGWSAREVSRKLKEARGVGLKMTPRLTLKDGVPLSSGGLLYVNHTDWSQHQNFITGLNPIASVDDEIICTARLWREKIADSNQPVIVVSQDTNILLECDALGVEAEDYGHDKTITSLSQLYRGYAEIKIIYPEFDFCTELYTKKSLPEDVVFKAIGEQELLANQCCFFLGENGQTRALAIYKKSKKLFRAVNRAKKSEKSIGPLDDEQALLWDLLKDPEIAIVTIDGEAGTGKTFVSMAAGCEQLDNTYQQLLVLRPIIEVGGKEIGFLPGDLDEKFQPWTEAILDNFELIEINLPQQYRAIGEPGQGLIKANKLKMSPIVHARGRSFHHKFVYTDETQNLTPSVVKTIATRAATGTKMIFAGDPEQIDDPYLHSCSNGLVYMIQRLKDHDFFGHMHLRNCKRQESTKQAAKLL